MRSIVVWLMRAVRALLTPFASMTSLTPRTCKF